ncbi:type II toxin-antitoxin system VapC family toxin [Phragmitibacter flavus]|uniref:Type II toxin-antitoxin system VapC family toxin n=1 Tax=Phragmitibacter flavus TaxID=2576071 RepID=A0A5R8KCM4_9BACT|nr:type II toxin-antitoxin system VapC family toxin [Phragmitibacter flavus]TLD70074.1 type II toxin-antitoxin system VapC family toxin [Phragmitibacter flavus]
MILVDTNVLLDLANLDPNWAPWSRSALGNALHKGSVGINIIIYTELLPSYRDPEELDRALSHIQIKRLPLPYSAAFPASRAFLAYRKSGGKRNAPLPDFFIGAHAEAEGHTILTRDPARYRQYFPTVNLICP